MSALAGMRCAVLGAGGFIGANLCRALQEAGVGVRAFGRRQAFPDALAGVEWAQGDFTDPTSHGAALIGCDTVVHLVSATNPASANLNMVADLEANVGSTLRLLDACRFYDIKRVVFISSGGTVYGAPRETPTPETHPTEPITAYGVAKLAIERYLFLHRHLYGLDYRVLRIANPYGPYQTAAKGQGVIAAFIERALAGQPIEIWGDGSVVRDYLYIGDAVDAIVLALAHDGPSRIFNIGGGEGHSVNDIVTAIETATGRALERRSKPGRAIDAPRSILDIALARAELGWRPKTPLIEGLAKTVAWWRRPPNSRSTAPAP